MKDELPKLILSGMAIAAVTILIALGKLDGALGFTGILTVAGVHATHSVMKGQAKRKAAKAAKLPNPPGDA